MPTVAGVLPEDGETVNQGVLVPCTAAVNDTEAGLLETAMACSCAPPPAGAEKNTGFGVAVRVFCACRAVTQATSNMLRKRRRTDRNVIFKMLLQAGINWACVPGAEPSVQGCTSGATMLLKNIMKLLCFYFNTNQLVTEIYRVIRGLRIRYLLLRREV
jgi:hypothetical protein